VEVIKDKHLKHIQLHDEMIVKHDRLQEGSLAYTQMVERQVELQNDKVESNEDLIKDI
jgi:hypothetical protein